MYLGSISLFPLNFHPRNTACVPSVQNLVAANPKATVLHAVLDGVAAGKTSALKGVVQDALSSQSKATRLRAIRAAQELENEPELAQALEEMQATATPEEEYLLNGAGR
jgi:hypothetical protein